MNKKSLIQLLVSIIFFGVTAYVMYGFFNADDQVGVTVKKNGDGVVSKLNVDSLLNRSFQTEQVDIFEKESFKKLKDNSVEIPNIGRSKIGKENPFEFAK